MEKKESMIGFIPSVQVVIALAVFAITFFSVPRHDPHRRRATDKGGFPGSLAAGALRERNAGKGPEPGADGVFAVEKLYGAGNGDPKLAYAKPCQAQDETGLGQLESRG